MTRFAAALFLTSLISSPIAAVEPEECLVRPGSAAAASVEYGGTVYELGSIECRELFLSDPERYAQLFDALAELGVSPSDPAASETVSLVPN